jgi:AraC-like DNA-binding protein/quercetin dioxygenase-like cupin family protein
MTKAITSQLWSIGLSSLRGHDSHTMPVAVLREHAESCRDCDMPNPRPFMGAPHVAAKAFEYAPGEHVPPHRHGRHQLLSASRGVMTVHTPRGAWVVPPHRGVWIPARVRHSIDMSGSVSMRTLYLRVDVARRWPDGCRVVNVPPLLRELILDAVERGGLDRAVPAQRHLVDVLLDQLDALPAAPLHLPEPRDARARRVTALLRDHPSDRRSFTALARGSGASRRTLERLFRSEIGMSFGRWRQQLRLSQALRLLAAGQAVTAVALDVGYESPSAFVAAFRRAFGTTPARYFRPLR